MSDTSSAPVAPVAAVTPVVPTAPVADAPVPVLPSGRYRVLKHVQYEDADGKLVVEAQPGEVITPDPQTIFGLATGGAIALTAEVPVIEEPTPLVVPPATVPSTPPAVS